MELKQYSIALWGFGLMNKQILKYALDKNYKITAVINKYNQGEDAGEVAKIGPIGVKITDNKDAQSVLADNKPDICIVATRSYIKDIEDSLQVLGSLGINTITIGEEAFYSWNSAPELTKKYDQLYKQNNATFTGAGFQDVWLGYLATLIHGAAHKVKKLQCICQFNVDDFGKGFGDSHGVCLTEEEFAKKFGPDAPITYAQCHNEWIVTRLGQKPVNTTHKLEPTFAPKEIYTSTYKQNIPTGIVNGQKATITTEGDGGLIVETIQYGQVYYDDLYDYVIWKIEGEPNIEIELKKPATAELTCAATLNRIKTIIEARPGYVPTNELGPLC